MTVRRTHGGVGLRVATVGPGTDADRIGLQPGDVILSIDGQPVADEIDFRFRSAEERFLLEVERNGIVHRYQVERDVTEPLGVQFEQLLGDGIHICNNRCVFCFIHQMPPRMRRSLYIRDDDFRLSFVHGNYITLTNLSSSELQRIVEQRLSPLYVSVHATDPAVRGMLLGRKDDAPVLDTMGWLIERSIDIHAQIVLCPGLNDGTVLEKTLEDLAALHPAATGRPHGVLSVAIVPVGLTRFRDRLPALRAPDAEYAERMVSMHRQWTRVYRHTIGSRFAWLSDEWYYLAGRSVPSRSYYEGFPQLEDGVGTTRLFLDDLAHLGPRLVEAAPSPFEALLVTGELAAPVIRRLSARLNAIRGVRTEVVTVKNEWFGGTITATGLLTGRDIVHTLRRSPSSAPVFVPDICLRESDGVFLDDMTVTDVRQATGRHVEVVAPRPRALAEVLGLTRRRTIR